MKGNPYARRLEEAKLIHQSNCTQSFAVKVKVLTEQVKKRLGIHYKGRKAIKVALFK